MAKSKSARYYAANPKARKKKKDYDTDYNRKRKSVKARVTLNRKNRKEGTYGNGDGKDWAHSASGKSMRLQSASKNRANNRPKNKQTRA